MDEVDRRREDEWFHQNEKQLLKAARLAREEREKERAAREASEERARLKQLHFMKCPKCGHDMKAEDLGGVEVDRCTYCEGIYMDAGELEQVFLKKQGAERQGLFRKLLGI